MFFAVGAGLGLQYFDHGGRRYHHILDTRTAAPRDAIRHSVTTTAPSCMAADAACTAVFGATDEEARRLLARGAPDVRLIAT